MHIKCFDDKKQMAKVAAEEAALILREAIQKKGKVRIIAATGAAQFAFLEVLTGLPNIDWQKVEMFHLDEYIGIPESHPASFCRFLKERLIQKTGITQHHLLHGDLDPAAVIRDAGNALAAAPIDVAFVGIGENGHLAFNDPPADFQTEEPYLIVELDEACRRQQLGEGWFATLEDVPRRAISMSIRQILKARKIICFVPDARKAKAVHACFDGEISPAAPASILRTHEHTNVYLDKESASSLSPATLASAS
ncbi:MAG TPA: glucosamine-6-phosphate deaminase [Terriglobales bacterium]|nr:glucosamine-6-phosphate deaminase [Terriglobales bacterium]